MRITIYQKPTCTTCRQVYKILKESGVDVESVNYFIDPLSRQQLQSLLKKMGLRAKDLLRKKEEIYRKLKLGSGERSEGELVDLMVRYPDLIQRPIVEKGNTAILARPAEKIRDLL